MVECNLAKVEVAGSNPVSRSSSHRPLPATGKRGALSEGPVPSDSQGARYPSGKGEVCKTFIRGFDSHPRLQSECQPGPDRLAIFNVMTKSLLYELKKFTGEGKNYTARSLPAF